MKLLTVALGLVLAGGPVLQDVETAATTPTRYVDVNGVRIAYRSLGAGSPLVLANRTRGTLDTWDPLFLDELARTHQVVTVDYPGIGYSDGRFFESMPEAAEFVRAFVAAIGLEKFTIVGWSWGGLVAQQLVVDQPHLISHAVLIGTHPPGDDLLPLEPSWIERALKPVNDLEDEEVLFFDPASDTSRKAARESHDRIYARPAVGSRIPAQPEQIRAFLTTAGAFRSGTAHLRRRLVDSGTPLLIISGDNDPSVPAENWYPLVGELSQAYLLVLPQAGHGPQHQYPILSADLIASFLQKTGS